MKKVMFVLFVIFCFALLKENSFSQTETTILDILKTATDKVTKLEDQGQEVVNFTVELLVGMTNGKNIFRNLDNSYEYTIFAIPDRKISKLSLSVYKKVGDEWKLYDEDSGTNPTITFKPKEYGMYQITVKSNGFNKDWGAGHTAVIIYHVIPE